jgi:lysine-N-methylase
MIVDKEGCAFLQSDGLCSIQLQYGEDYLCNSCATYPRVTNSVNGVLEKSATVACPEIARIVLQQEGGITFSQYEEDSSIRNMISNKLDAKAPKYLKKGGKYFEDMRIFSLQVLHTREYSLNERFVILGLFYEQVEKELATGKAARIPEIIEEITNNIDKYLQQSYDNAEKDNLRLDDFYFNSLQYLGQINTNPEDAQFRKNYQEVYENNYLSVKKYEYMMENYLVNYAFQIVFPINDKYQLFETYIVLMLHFVMIQNQLLSVADQLKTLSVEHVTDYIQYYSSRVEHNITYYDKMLSQLQATQTADMSYLAYLILYGTKRD